MDVLYELQQGRSPLWYLFWTLKTNKQNKHAGKKLLFIFIIMIIIIILTQPRICQMDNQKPKPLWLSEQKQQQTQTNKALKKESFNLEFSFVVVLYTHSVLCIMAKKLNNVTAVALYNFDGDLELKQLSLKEGDFIKVTKQQADGWWLGQLMDGQSGYFPADLVLELISPNNLCTPSSASSTPTSLLKKNEGTRSSSFLPSFFQCFDCYFDTTEGQTQKEVQEGQQKESSMPSKRRRAGALVKPDARAANPEAYDNACEELSSDFDSLMQEAMKDLSRLKTLMSSWTKNQHIGHTH